MEMLNAISPGLSAIFPTAQLQLAKKYLGKYKGEISRLEESLKKCPALGDTIGMDEHPAAFHYFYKSVDIYICEYSPEKRLMFGYSVMFGNLENSEWGYIDLDSILTMVFLNLDLYWGGRSIEAALYEKYPDFFEKPLSLGERG